MAFKTSSVSNTPVILQYPSPEAVLAAAGSIHSELANVVDSLLSAAESSRQKSAEMEAKLREQHLAMKSGEIDVKVLKTFLLKYAPLQLLNDRKSHKRLHLSSRRVMNACAFVHAATELVHLAESSPGDKPLVDKMAALISLDKRLSLPHPLWTSKHDAVLIHAIAKHGWIDNDASCRQITKDATILWGFPFDCEKATNGSEDAKKTSQKDELINSLKDTATRASALLNNHHEIIEDFSKFFNQNLVVRAYCLAHEDDSSSCSEGDNETTTAEKKPRWVVDEMALLASTGLLTSDSQDFVELPTKKDLVKRAKLVLARTPTNVSLQPQIPSASAAISGCQAASEEDYRIIDQSDRCNVLLAEILKAIVKTPYPKSQNSIKVLCSIASEEAGKRQASMLVPSGSQDKSKTRVVEEMEETMKNIALVRRHLKQTKQAKNILRAILGIEVVKNARGGNFPVDRKFPLLKSPPAKTGEVKAKKEDNAIGDRALARAVSKCFDRNGGGPGRVLPEGHPSDLELTAIETLLISVILSQGIPVWDKEKASSLLSGSQAATDKMTGKFELCWLGLGSVLARAAKEWHKLAALKVEACQHDYQKYENQEADTQPKIRARKHLANAIKIEGVKELAAAQAEDYASDPEILAKKTIMLIERLRRKMGRSAGGHTKPARQANHLLGPRVFDFLADQLTAWAKILDIIDCDGRTLSYTAADFYHDLPAEERERVEIASTINKQDCRQLLIQITLISRLRSLFVKYPKEELITRTDVAAKSCKANDPWDSQPAWWRTQQDSPSYCDHLLLESLVEFGMCEVLDNAKGFGGEVRHRNTPPLYAVSFRHNTDRLLFRLTYFCSCQHGNDQLTLKDLGWTKAMVQQRANQLARELHDLERSDNLIGEMAQSLPKNEIQSSEAKEPRQTGKSMYFTY